MNAKFISINPCFYTELGHNYYYLKSVEKACRLIGWDFSALVPQKNIIENLPSSWGKNLNCPTIRICYKQIEKKTYKRPRRLIRAKQRSLYYLSLFRTLHKILKKDKKSSKIIFYEAFSVGDIRLFTNLIPILPRKHLKVWLVFRYPSSFIKEDLGEYRRLLTVFKKNRVPFKLITDTDLLQKDLTQSLGYKVEVFPIPLPKEPVKKYSKPDYEPIKCWWPGIVRAGKGLEHIQKFSSSKNDSNKLIELIAAKSANLIASPKGPKLNILEDDLSKANYDHHLAHSDFILLPYIDSCYEKTSSNGFAEALVAGKIPVVFPKTWMAFELKKFHLQELILDWESSSLSDQLVRLYQNQSIQIKLKQMQDHYLRFHNIANYSKSMAKLLKKQSQ